MADFGRALGDIMPSSAHQWLLVWATRRMNADGFVLGGFESPAIQAGIWNSLPAPFALKRVRPDAWGLRPKDSLLAFAEAKTAGDIDTKHTRDQLRVFAFTHLGNDPRPCPVYVAVPRSCAGLLDRVLVDLGLICARHLVRLHIPDVLLSEQQDVSYKTQ